LVLIDEQNVQYPDAGDRADLLDDPPDRLDRPDIKNGDGKMNLIDNWKTVAKKAWSVRLTLLSALTAIIGAVLPYLDQGGESIVALSAILAVLAALSRVIAQPALHAQDEATKKIIERLEKGIARTSLTPRLPKRPPEHP
jgi:hypothetical protein